MDAYPWKSAIGKDSRKLFTMKNSPKMEEDKTEQDSLPIHCIVQTISTMEDVKSVCCEHCDGGRPGEELQWECECNSNEMSGCVVVPEETSMCDLVRTALVKLGYPTFASSFATGAILIRNWKPLPLEAICREMKKPVVDILGELTAVVSLRIRIFWPKMTILQKMKDNLLFFLIKANQSFLRDSGCPFDMCALSKFCQRPDHNLQQPSDDLQKKFDAWLQHLQETEEGKVQTNPQPNTEQNPDTIERKSVPEEEEKEERLAKESPSFSVMERPKNFPVPKTRVRTSFDPEFELPKLHKWYLDNPHPSRQQIYEYVAELNSLESRKGRKQLDVNNVVYWFKNARAAQKRTECRRFANAPATETNRCNLLKIPQGDNQKEVNADENHFRKNCGVISDDQRSISDDEGSVTSESGDDYRNENGRCLQVVGKWNSNGQGEAVLEMQIAAHKNEFVQSVVQTKKEKISENEGSTDGDSSDFVRRNPGTTEKSATQKENQAINIMENNKNETKTGEAGDGKQKQSPVKKEEVPSSKLQVRNAFPSYKENNSGDFLSSYKPGFPVSPNSLLGHPFICMSQYMTPKPNNLPLSSEERRKRNRTFIDPVTEVPRLEQWFRLSTHPSHSLISRYTEELNNMPYRRKFPKLEAKNVQFWFKNRRAKNKRLNYLESANN